VGRRLQIRENRQRLHRHFYAQTCFVVKTDSDSDTNDDYVDEYE
jgi:hypothetical protein